MERSPAIPNTLSIHKIERRQYEHLQATLDFFKLLIEPKPFHVQTYSSFISCGHVEEENQTLAEMRSTFALCLHKYENSNEVEDWLKCPICLQWFHETCLDYKIVAV